MKCTCQKRVFSLNFYILIVILPGICSCSRQRAVELRSTGELHSAGSRSSAATSKSDSAPYNLESRVLDRSGVVRSKKIYIAPLEFDQGVIASAPPEKNIYGLLKTAVDAELQVEALIDKSYLTENVSPPLGSKREEWIRQRARSLGADSILYTRLNQYEERIGSKVGITRPGRVNFQMILKPLSSDDEFWVASYHYTDKLLSDDFLQARSYMDQRKHQAGKSIVTILEEGFAYALDDFSVDRSTLFSGL